MISEAYMNSVGRLPQMMEAIQNAGVPQRFTIEFLKSLGFKGTNDRVFIPTLKGIGFLDTTGTPTEKYRLYKNKSNGKRVLGEALRASYEDIFLADENAQNASADKIAGIFATKTGKGVAVTKKMATTFKALASLASFDDSVSNVSDDHDDTPELSRPQKEHRSSEFHYNIQIHLPSTKDISVYNAIFKSLKDHLL